MKLVPLWLLAVLWLALLAGCSARPGAAPYIKADLPHLGTFDLGGDAAQPGSLATSAGGASIDIPAGAAVTVAPDGAITFTAAEPVRIETRTASATLGGPVAYPPPAAPTPSDNADATARLWAWIAAGLGVVGLALGFLKGWPLVRAGGLCLAAAAVAILALQAVPDWIWAIVGLGAVLALAGPLLWRFVIRAQVENKSPAGHPVSLPA